jgi:bacillolysin
MSGILRTNSLLSRGLSRARITLAFIVCLIALIITYAGLLTRRAGAATGGAASVQAPQQTPDAAAKLELDALKQSGSSQAVSHVSRETHKYNFVRANGGEVLVADNTSATPQARALTFLSQHGALIGLNDVERQFMAGQVNPLTGLGSVAASAPASELRVARVNTDELGVTHVRFEQFYKGVRVFGAQTVVHMNNRGITAVNGDFVPDINLGTTPRVTAANAAQIAVVALGKQLRLGNLRATKTELSVYRMGLLEGYYGQSVLAYNVQVAGPGKVLEQVWINAVSGAILNQISLSEGALYRIAYTPQYDPNNPNMFVVRKEGDPPLSPIPGQNTAIDNLYDYTGQTYNFYASAFGRDSYDALGKTMRTVLLANDQCPNAYWNGSTTNYCPGFDEDDVVSHEWSHAYTEYTHGLIYSYQSGALNESYSDIFGETVDLINGVDGSGGSDNVNHAQYTDVNGQFVKTGGGARFQIGEDFQGLNQPAAGILRDMYTPSVFGNPDKVSSANYSCGSGDNGGVHNNSGVPNHAYALAVDGGTFNGQTINGIGLTKAAPIWFRAESVYQTPTTNFAAHQQAIETSCSDLIGKDIYVLKTNTTTRTISAEKITPQDCQEVHKALLAVEMSNPTTQCNFPPLLDPATPDVCQGASTILNEDWESGSLNGWTLASVGERNNAAGMIEANPDWPNTNWTIRGTLPDGRPGKAAFAIDSTGGSCAAGGDISGHFALISPAINVPSGATRLQLSFDHYVETESGFDGGNLLVKVNNGAFTLVPQDKYIFNRPNTQLTAAVNPGGNASTDPKAGEDAWTGSNISTGKGSWGTTLVDLSSLAQPGDTIQLKYDFGQDGCGGATGWFVDNVRVFNCPALAAPMLSLGSDYNNPDADGSYTLNWTRPSGASGPDVLQVSNTSCGPLFADDAESGLNNWTTTTDGVGAFAWETSTAKPQHTGTAFWARAAEGAMNASSILTLQRSITVPAAGTTFLNFSDWDVNEGDDNVYVEASTDGTTWTPIYTHNRSELAPDAVPAFANEPLFQRSVSLANYGGQTIRLRFRYTVGPDDRAGSTPFGWYVDDIAIVSDSWNDLTSTANQSFLTTVTSGGTRCYRVRTSYTFGSALVQSPFSNIVSATTILPTNYALSTLGAIATASTEYPGGGYPASSAIDGEHRGLNWGSGGGWADGTRDEYPDWLQVDFNGAKTINEIRVYTLQDVFTNGVEPTPSMNCTYYGLIDFDVQYWDGSNWVTVPNGSVTGNDKVMRVFTFPAISTGKIRVLSHNGRVHYSRIVELEALGAGGQ